MTGVGEKTGWQASALRAGPLSEHLYFAAGAAADQLGPFTLYRFTGTPPSPLSLVAVQRAPAGTRDVAAALQALEEMRRDVRAPVARLYLHTDAETIDFASLRRAAPGLGWGREMLYACAWAPPFTPPGEPRLSFRPHAAADTAKIHLLSSLPKAPDGHVHAPVDLARTEEIKAADGPMIFFLAYVEDEAEPVGSVGTYAVAEGYYRLKNLVVRADCHGRGLGKRIAWALMNEMAARGGTGAVAYALEGHVSCHMYARAGFEALGSIVELRLTPQS